MLLYLAGLEVDILHTTRNVMTSNVVQCTYVHVHVALFSVCLPTCTYMSNALVVCM